MRGVYDGFEQLGERGEAWFAGANTEAGFRGSYGSIADEGRLDRLYIIKGGSGTGKSTLIRRLADAAEKNGFSAVRYLCGSDPDSLDAAVLGGRIAVLDGTTPHTLDTRYPGAASEIIDVGRFWDAGMLEEAREEIETRCALKAAAYAGATRWLAAAEKVGAEEKALANELFDRDKAAQAIRRLAAKRGKGPGREADIRRYDHAVTMRGRVRLSGLSDGAEKLFVVEDAYGTAQLFLPMLADALRDAGWPLVVGLHPLGGRITGVRAGSCAFSAGHATGEGAVLRMTRFLLDGFGVRSRMRLAAKIRESCLTEADAYLAEAARHHFALENIYRPAMDFDALRTRGDALRDEILGRLEKPCVKKTGGHPSFLRD